MILNHTKLGPTYTFMKDSGTVFSFEFSTKIFNLKENGISRIKFAKSCRAGSESAK